MRSPPIMEAIEARSSVVVTTFSFFAASLRPATIASAAAARIMGKRNRPPIRVCMFGLLVIVSDLERVLPVRADVEGGFQEVAPFRIARLQLLPPGLYAHQGELAGCEREKT